jgi:hypothetical protein
MGKAPVFFIEIRRRKRGVSVFYWQNCVAFYKKCSVLLQAMVPTGSQVGNFPTKQQKSTSGSNAGSKAKKMSVSFCKYKGCQSRPPVGNLPAGIADQQPERILVVQSALPTQSSGGRLPTCSGIPAKCQNSPAI